MKNTVFTFILAVLVPLAAFASKRAGNRPYVQGMDGPSVFYARCIPDGPMGNKGTTTIMRVEAAHDVEVDQYPWYSPRGVVLGWSPLKGKVAVMAFPDPSPDQEDRVEFSFYLAGTLLASYTTSDLQKLGVDAGPSHEGGKASQYKLLGVSRFRVPTNMTL